MGSSVPDERLPVWEALSEFFLDSELDTGDHEHIASRLASSTYSIRELEDILHFEVYPACRSNLLDVAGAWAGFSMDWIMEYIAPRKDKRPKTRVPSLDQRMFQGHWNEVSRLIEAKRSIISGGSSRQV